MLVSLFSKSQSSLSAQAKHLVAMRFLIYTGFQTSYFIGVIGTLTYADDASVVATSLAVLFMNVFVILGSFAGGAALDAWGPRRHFLLSIVAALATGAAILAFGSATGTVLAGAVLLGFVMGFAQPIATSYPAYLTDDPVELKDINSAITMFSNVSIIVGPTLGGFVAAAASSRAVFVLTDYLTVLKLVYVHGRYAYWPSRCGHSHKRICMCSAHCEPYHHLVPVGYYLFRRPFYVRHGAAHHVKNVLITLKSMHRFGRCRGIKYHVGRYYPFAYAAVAGVDKAYKPLHYLHVYLPFLLFTVAIAVRRRVQWP